MFLRKNLDFPIAVDLVHSLICQLCRKYTVLKHRIEEGIRVRVSEVEEILGIDRETIRFYIRKGLLEPRKDKNGYREYTDEDVRRIKKILVLRSLELSIQDIRKVIGGEKDIADELENSMKLLSEKKARIDSAIAACRELMEKDTIAFDPEPYFRRGDRAFSDRA